MTLQLTFISELISSFWWIHDENKFSWTEYLKRAEGKSHNGPQQLEQNTETKTKTVKNKNTNATDPAC